MNSKNFQLKINQLKFFATEHWPAVMLFLFGIFLIFVRSSGSLNGDEAIYARVASETLSRDSWLVLFWRDNIWMEKPPLFLWLEMLMLKIFGLNEVALRFPSGIFGVLTAVLTYFFTYSLFKNKLGSFVAGLVIYSIPLFIVSMRNGMMDTMVVFFITLATWAAYQAVYRNPRWYYIFYLATGLAIMTKNIIGFIPFLSLGLLLALNKKVDKELFWGITIFLFTILPWHLFMSFKFGGAFWQEYLGYHVIDRFEENVINSPYANYLDTLLNRFGIWFVMFIFLIIFSRNLIVQHKREFSLLLGSMILILIIFSFASTKSPHYILPIVPLLAVSIGAMIGYLFRQQNKMLIILAVISILNFTPHFVLLTSDYGESQILLSTAIDHFFDFSEAMQYWIAIMLSMSIILLGFFYFYKYKGFRLVTISVAIFIIIIMNIFIPFYPDRGNLMKKVGLYISNEINPPLPKYIFVSLSEEHRTNTLLAYLPLDVFAEKINHVQSGVVFEEFNSDALCLNLYSNLISQEITGEIIYTFDEGFLVWCR